MGRHTFDAELNQLIDRVDPYLQSKVSNLYNQHIHNAGRATLSGWFKVLEVLAVAEMMVKRAKGDTKAAAIAFHDAVAYVADLAEPT